MKKVVCVNQPSVGFVIGSTYDVIAETVDSYLINLTPKNPHNNYWVDKSYFREYEPQNTAYPEQPEEYTGGSSSYYKIKVEHPTTLINPYEAECNDIIEALGMNFAEGNIFKALWRRANARKNGVKKKGYTDGKYDAEKILFFAERLLKMEGE